MITKDHSDATARLTANPFLPREESRHSQVGR